MPLVMSKLYAAKFYASKFYAVIAVVVLVATGGCTSLNLNPTTWKMPSLSSEEAQPGTSEWWKKHKKADSKRKRDA